MLTSAALGLLSLPSLASLAWPSRRKTFDEPKRNPYRGSDDQLLDEIERAAFDFFWNEASSTTGQVRDRALLNGSDRRRVASIAATGFGLSRLCIGECRGYGKAAAIRDRVRQTLRFLKVRLPNEHGFFYHFIDIETGERVWNCELSSIDTSLVLCGVLTARQHFNDPETTGPRNRDLRARGLGRGCSMAARRSPWDGNRTAISCALDGTIIASL
jgi:hypothetical protein